MLQCIFNWSGGKDSALALYYCLQNPEIKINYLVTTVNDHADRISMHGVRVELLIIQAERIGIPLYQIRLPEMSSMEVYDGVMHTQLTRFAGEGITHAIYGDIFLEDLKTYRDARLADAGLTGIYPLWKRNTSNLITEFLSLGFGAVIACTQERLERIAGKEISEELILSLPDTVDPCGENGEFHSFTFKGPIFSKAIGYRTGDKVYKTYKSPDATSGGAASVETSGFWFCDLISAE
jgi:uncharacterized protein (TIGR00290 family)